MLRRETSDFEIVIPKSDPFYASSHFTFTYMSNKKYFSHCADQLIINNMPPFYLHFTVI